jgi:hypothetical protein
MDKSEIKFKVILNTIFELVRYVKICFFDNFSAAYDAVSNMSALLNELIRTWSGYVLL